MTYNSDGSLRRWPYIAGWGVAIVIVLTVASLFLATAKTDRDVIGLSYGGGPFEGRHFQGILQPGRGLTFVGWFDPVYKYPVTQRSYIISLDHGDVVGEITVASKDEVKTGFQVSTYFRLNTDKIQEFHEVLGLKYQAWTEEGWDHLLQETLQQQIRQAIRVEAAKEDAVDLWADEPTQVRVQAAIGARLKDLVEHVVGDNYFCGVEFVAGKSCPEFTFVINTVTLPENVVKSLEANRTSLIDVETRANEVSQAEKQAEAIEALNEALEKAGPAYTLLKAVESGKVTFWVLDGQDLTIQAPAAP